MWTKEKPNVPGYYWVSTGIICKLDIVKLENDNEQYWSMNDEFPLRDKDIAFWWSVPIAEPPLE